MAHAQTIVPMPNGLTAGQVGHAPLMETWDKQEVCAYLGVSSRRLEGLVAEGAFPPAVRLGKRAYWSAGVVRRWHERLFFAQETWLPRT